MKQSISMGAVIAALALVLAACGGDSTQENPQAITPPSPVDNTPVSALEKRKAIAKIVSILRFYHPSEEAMAADWERLTAYALRASESAQTRTAFINVLSDAFHPVAPTMALNGVRKQPKAAVTGERVAMHYRGGYVGKDNNSCLQDAPRNITPSLYYRERLTAGNGLPMYFPATEDFSVRVDGGIDVSIPVVLAAISGNALPDGSPLPAGVAAETLDINNPYAVTAGFISLWSGMRHFYPYWQEMDQDAEQLLVSALNQPTPPASKHALFWQITEYLAPFQDGHIRVAPGFSPFTPQGALPIDTAWVEDKIVVTRLDHDYTGPVAVGDVVVSINQQPTRQWLDDYAPFLSIAPSKKDIYGGLTWALVESIRRDPITFTIEDPFGNQSTQQISHAQLTPYATKGEQQWTEQEPAVQMLEQDIYLMRFSQNSEAAELRQQVSGAKALIIDLRGQYNSNTAFEFMRYIGANGSLSQRYHVRHPTLPWQQQNQDENVGWQLPRLSPAIDIPVYLLMDRHTQSSGETLLNTVKGNTHVSLIGEPTRGANGNISCMQMWGGIKSGGFTVLYTGMHVANLDGSQHHAIGTLPDIEVKPTLSAIRAGVDEALEEALRLARLAI